MDEHGTAAPPAPAAGHRSRSLIRGGGVIAFVAIGFVLLASSGRADGFVLAGIKGLLLLALLPSVPLFLYLLVAAFVPSRRVSRGPRLRACAGIAFAWLLVFAGMLVTDRLTAETMARGDRLMALIESHRQRTGGYPASLDALAAAGTALPEPALAGSAFHYARDPRDGYRIVFAADALLLCMRTPSDGRWYCSD